MIDLRAPRPHPEHDSQAAKLHGQWSSNIQCTPPTPPRRPVRARVAAPSCRTQSLRVLVDDGAATRWTTRPGRMLAEVRIVVILSALGVLLSPKLVRLPLYGRGAHGAGGRRQRGEPRTRPGDARGCRLPRSSSRSRAPRRSRWPRAYSRSASSWTCYATWASTASRRAARSGGARRRRGRDRVRSPRSARSMSSIAPRLPAATTS